MRKKTLGALVALVAGGWVQNAAALDLSPGDYIHLPDGSIVLVSYLNYTKADSFKDQDGRNVPGSEAEIASGVQRALYYGTTSGGLEWAVQAILPFGSISAEIGGADLPTENGVGDLTLGAGVWLMSSQEPTGTTLGFTSYLTLPTGNYDPFKPSIGAGAYALAEQVGLSQGLGYGFVLDLSADVQYRFDHTDNGIEVSQDPFYQVQSYLRYNFSPTTSVSAGYSGTFGGKVSYNGVDSGGRVREDQLRLFASTFVAPTVQLQGMVGTTVNVKAGFEQDIVSQLRIVKLF